MNPDLPTVGEAISNTELARRFACSNMGGMRHSPPLLAPEQTARTRSTEEAT